MTGDIANGRRASRVLVVDDERHITRLIEFVLTKQGYSVAVAHSAEEALNTVEAFLPDAMLLDLGLPGMSGLEATRRLRADERFARLPIMILTARSFEHLPEELKSAGATYLRSKPIAPTTLIKDLKECGIPPLVTEPPAIENDAPN